jgi:hypothetical protein
VLPRFSRPGGITTAAVYERAFLYSSGVIYSQNTIGFSGSLSPTPSAVPISLNVIPVFSFFFVKSSVSLSYPTFGIKIFCPSTGTLVKQ